MVDETKIIGFLLQDTLNLIIFAPMEIDLEINSVNDYANDIGAPLTLALRHPNLFFA